VQALFSLVLAWAFLPSGLARGAGASGGALTISEAGTYSGQWTSNDPAVPVIVIATAEPVLIENSTLTGPGPLIAASVEHVKVTVRNTHGTGVNLNLAGKSTGRFLTAESFDSIVIENNDLEQTAGIYLLTYSGSPKAETTVRVLANRVHNIDGRHSDGAGGFQADVDAVQFVQLDQVQHVPNIEIAWNQVTNDPGKSAVEDNISIYKSSGTKASPIRIHDNFINGAYPANPLSADYSGGGIMLGDGMADTPDGGSEYVVAFNNQVINTTNYGMAISAGSHCTMHHNRILSTGVLPDGTPLPAQNVGIYVWDSNKKRAKIPKGFSDNGGFANRVGWMQAGQRHDWWTPDAARWKDNIRWPGLITAKTVDDELALWTKKLAKDHVTVGPVSP
jgi:hypothetical protein